MIRRAFSFGDFRCSNCQAFVSTAHLVSAVNNRNHCPYCLWSSHLDLFAAGDRLSACKARMRPIGLSMKKGRNKYQCQARGELMLIHECMECRALSINRIAADDDSATIIAVFRESLTTGHQVHAICEQQGIITLKAKDTKIIHTQLYGHYTEIPIISGIEA